MSGHTRREALAAMGGTGAALLAPWPAAAAGTGAGAGTGAPPLGPNVTVIDPALPTAQAQARVDAIFRQQERAHFTDARHAVLLLPGDHRLDVDVGFFTQVAGLGLAPGDVRVAGHVHAEADWNRGDALVNFWRGAENLAVRPPDGVDRWAVSQAAPYRRVHLAGDLLLDDGGWSSGGFMADCRVDGTVRSGSQQQWFTRTSALGGWRGANWNMVFAGVRGAPPTSFPEPPITALPAVPVIREKPFLYADAGGPGGDWGVFRPALRRDAVGPGWGEGGPGVGERIPLDRFLVADPATPLARINAALAAGRHLLLTPGVYRLAGPIRVARAGTVVLGLGLATLLATAGTAVLEVADVPGVTLAGLLVDAGPILSPVLVRVGPPGAAGDHAADPTLVADLFVRVGGAAPARAGTAVEVNSRHVLLDHLWLWRADHGPLNGTPGGLPGSVGWEVNPAERGLVVNGADVTALGLFVEHFRQEQVVWAGERGRCCFYQSELPYDPPSQAAFSDAGGATWPSYRVADGVRHHEAVGLGIYCNFTADPRIVMAEAIRAPRTPGVSFASVTTVSLGGGEGTIAYLVNDAGAAARRGAVRQTLRRYP